MGIWTGDTIRITTVGSLEQVEPPIRLRDADTTLHALPAPGLRLIVEPVAAFEQNFAYPDPVGADFPVGLDEIVAGVAQ